MLKALVTVLPDVAPDPITRTFTLLPVILVGALVIVCAVFLKKRFLK